MIDHVSMTITHTAVVVIFHIYYLVVQKIALTFFYHTLTL